VGFEPTTPGLKVGAESPGCSPDLLVVSDSQDSGSSAFTARRISALCLIRSPAVRLRLIPSGLAISAGSPVRSIVSAASGKMSTDNRPAAIMAAPVASLSSPSSIPICAAATMKISDVAWSSPPPAPAGRAREGCRASPEDPAPASRAARKIGTSAIVDALPNSASRLKRSPLVTRAGTMAPEIHRIRMELRPISCGASCSPVMRGRRPARRSLSSIDLSQEAEARQRR